MLLEPMRNQRKHHRYQEKTVFIVPIEDRMKPVNLPNWHFY